MAIGASKNLATTKISKYFTIGDFSKTSTGAPNMPPADIVKNLTRLAEVGDILYDKIGPFSIESAYRSQATQDALKSGAGGAAAAAQAATKSYHTQGIAFDIIPHNKTPQQYQALIAMNGPILNMLGEIATKKTVLHISLATPTKTGVLMYVDQAGQYIRLKAEEIAALLSKYKKPIAISGAVLALLGIAAFLYMRNRRK
jgi:hypothetical protein